MRINLKYNNFLDLINIKHGVYSPVREFLSKEDFLSVVKNYHLKNGKFFPLPIFINISQKLYDLCRIKNKYTIAAFYKSQKICDLKIKSFYKINKKKIGKLIFFTKDIKHPGFKDFIDSENYFAHCKIIRFKKKIMKKLYFSYPHKLKLKFKKKKLKKIVGFHTRNAPHRAHEWIHDYGLKRCNALLIHPMIGQSRQNEYKASAIIKSNAQLVKKIYKKKNIFLEMFNSYPRYAGPREALFHAIVRKNYGCTHFLVGRDHAGVGKYYKKYQSQKFCKKYKAKLKIKIISFNEPYLCTTCNKIINKKCLRCKKNSKKIVKGTFIRNLLKLGKKIPENYMRKEISLLLGADSII